MAVDCCRRRGGVVVDLKRSRESLRCFCEATLCRITAQNMPTYGHVVQYVTRIVAAILVVVASRFCVKNEEACQPKNRQDYVTTSQSAHMQPPAPRCVSASDNSCAFNTLNIVNDSNAGNDYLWHKADGHCVAIAQPFNSTQWYRTEYFLNEKFEECALVAETTRPDGVSLVLPKHKGSEEAASQFCQESLLWISVKRVFTSHASMQGCSGLV